MRINIVCRDHTSGQILARLAAELLTHPAFTVSEQPDPTAELNLYMPYLEFVGGFTATPTAAWFTHRDEGRDSKVSLWNDCAQAVDLRLTSAKIYMSELEQYGKTALVTTPLDREKFSPVKHETHDKPVIGTSGFVYPGGRKGETLFGRLAADHPDCSFVAGGQGWPVPTIHYSWEDMQHFYQSLDIYVCTSSIEGIGYGPLEAMACGIPVVIPRGVGVFDELPDLENVHRYKAGDYKSLKAALQVALSRLEEKAINVESLRSATARFSREAWVNEYLTAFESLLYDKPVYKPEYPWQGKACVYYVAYGEPARDCAVRAIASFKKYMPGIPVVLVSDKALNAGEDVLIEHADSDVGARSVKTQIYDLCPAEFEYILYLDADTELIAPVDFLYQLLEDGWDMTIAMNPAQYVLAREMRRPDNQDECDITFKLMGSDEMLQFNGGVFALRRNESTERLFRNWHAEWMKYGRRDQAALDRAFYSEPIRIYTLGVEWNTITRYEKAERSAAVLHYPMTARRWRGMLNGRLDSSEAWAAVHPETKDIK